MEDFFRMEISAAFLYLLYEAFDLFNRKADSCYKSVDIVLYIVKDYEGGSSIVVMRCF